VKPSMADRGFDPRYKLILGGSCGKLGFFKYPPYKVNREVGRCQTRGYLKALRILRVLYERYKSREGEKVVW